MGQRKVIIKQSVANSIAEIAWYIESKGMLSTAEKFANSVYNFIEKLADDRKSYRLCRDPHRSLIGFKCSSFNRNYSIEILLNNLTNENQALMCFKDKPVWRFSLSRLNPDKSLIFNDFVKGQL